MEKVLSELNKHYPIKVKNKSDSTLMIILSWIMFFNRQFMTHYVTTIGNTVYMPSTAKDWPRNAILSILTHEFVHVHDGQKDKLFELKYLFPQILAPLFLALLPFCWWLALVLFVICLLPWPAPWRKKYELRAYKMSLLGFKAYFEGSRPDEWIEKELQETAEFQNSQFVGAGYWFMWPWGVKPQLKQAINDIRTGDIFREDGVYAIGYDAIKNSK